MRNNIKKLSVEKVLDSMHLEPINGHNLDNAKTRVWNKLSHSIDNFDNTNKMSQIEPTAQEKTFWNKYHKSFLSFGIVALVVASTVGTTAYLTLKDKDKNQVAQTDRKPADNSGSLDDLKMLAAQRFEALTGITYDEYQVVAANAKNTERNAQENATLANGIGSTQGFAAPQGQNSTKIAPTLDPERVRELNTKAEKNKIKVYYTESEVKISNIDKLKTSPFGLGFAAPSLSYGPNINPNVDLSKPLTVKSWFGANYSKESVSQNGKILSMHIFTPEFELDFRGGKYAVRASHSNPEYFFMGLTENEDQNPDLYFIKHILSEESSFKKTGTKVVDGKTLTIFEDTFSSEMMSARSLMSDVDSPKNMKIKYYVDVDNLQVKITENYTDDVLLVSTTKKEVKEYSQDASQIVSDYSELARTEVKNISRDNNFPIEVKEQKLADLVKKYPIYYVNGERISSVYDGSDYEKMQQEDPYLKLVNTKDFDPNFDLMSNFVDGIQAPNASYGQYNLYFNIYKAKPSRFENAAKNDDKSYKVNQTPTVVQIDGRNVNATLYTETYNFTNSFEKNSGAETAMMPTSSTNNTLVFEVNGIWYEVSESVQENGKKPTLTNGPIKLVSLSREEAVKMDADNVERNNSYPELDYGMLLNSIAKDIRLLPGDLSESQKVVAQMISTPKSSATAKACEKFNDTLSLDCLIVKFGGFRIDFGTKYDEKVMMSNTPVKSNYFQYTVLNAKSSDTSALIEKIKENGYYGSMGITSKEISGKTVIISGEMSQDQVNKILNGVSIDNGLDTLSKQLETGLNGVGNPTPLKMIPADMMTEPAIPAR